MGMMQKKIIAGLVAVTVMTGMVQDVVYAQGMIGVQPMVETTHIGLPIPSSVGKFIEEYRGNTKKHVYVIQDAHCNKEAQAHIKTILEALKARHRNALRVVGVEGSVGPIDTRVMQRIQNKGIRTLVSRYLVRQGYMTGAEWYSVEHPNTVQLVGVEDEELYWANYERLMSLYGCRERITEELGDVKRVLERGKEVLYPEALKELEEREQKYLDGEIRLGEYIQSMHNAECIMQNEEKRKERRKQCPMSNYQCPMEGKEIETYRAMQSMHIDENMVRLEALKVVALLREKFGNKGITQLNMQTGEEYYRLLKEILHTNSITIESQYPALSEYFRYLDYKSSINEQKLVDEVALLTYREKQRMLVGWDDAARVMESMRYITLIERMLNTTATQEEVNTWLRERVKLQQISEETNEMLYRKNYVRRMKEELEKAEESMEGFYGIAEKRNEIMIQSMQNAECIMQNEEKRKERRKQLTMNNERGCIAPVCHSRLDRESSIFLTGNKPILDVLVRPEHDKEGCVAANIIGRGDGECVLIVGGYHTEGVTRILRSKGISYSVIMPVITQHDEKTKKIYEARMKEQKEIKFVPVFGGCKVRDDREEGIASSSEKGENVGPLAMVQEADSSGLRNFARFWNPPVSPLEYKGGLQKDKGGLQKDKGGRAEQHLQLMTRCAPDGMRIEFTDEMARSLREELQRWKVSDDEIKRCIAAMQRVCVPRRSHIPDELPRAAEDPFAVPDGVVAALHNGSWLDLLRHMYALLEASRLEVLKIFHDTLRTILSQDSAHPITFKQFANLIQKFLRVDGEEITRAQHEIIDKLQKILTGYEIFTSPDVVMFDGFGQYPDLFYGLFVYRSQLYIARWLLDLMQGYEQNIYAVGLHEHLERIIAIALWEYWGEPEGLSGVVCTGVLRSVIEYVPLPEDLDSMIRGVRRIETITPDQQLYELAHRIAATQQQDFFLCIQRHLRLLYTPDSIVLGIAVRLERALRMEEERVQREDEQRAEEERARRQREDEEKAEEERARKQKEDERRTEKERVRKQKEDEAETERKAQEEKARKERDDEREAEKEIRDGRDSSAVLSAEEHDHDTGEASGEGNEVGTPLCPPLSTRGGFEEGSEAVVSVVPAPMQPVMLAVCQGTLRAIVENMLAGWERILNMGLQHTGLQALAAQCASLLSRAEQSVSHEDMIGLLRDDRGVESSGVEDIAGALRTRGMEVEKAVVHVIPLLTAETWLAAMLNEKTLHMMHWMRAGLSTPPRREHFAKYMELQRDLYAVLCKTPLEQTAMMKASLPLLVRSIQPKAQSQRASKRHEEKEATAKVKEMIVTVFSEGMMSDDQKRREIARQIAAWKHAGFLRTLMQSDEVLRDEVWLLETIAAAMEGKSPLVPTVREQLLRREIALHEQLNNTREVLRMRRALAPLLEEWGKQVDAVGEYETVMTMLPADDTDARAGVLERLGALYHAAENAALLRETKRRLLGISVSSAEAMMQAYQDPEHDAALYLERGRELHAEARYADAYEMYARSLRMYTDETLHDVPLLALAETYEAQGEVAKEIEIRQQVADLYAETGNRAAQERVLRHIVSVCRAHNHTEEELTALQELETMYQAQAKREEQQSTLVRIAQIYESMSNYDAAIDAYTTVGKLDVQQDRTTADDIINALVRLLKIRIAAYRSRNTIAMYERAWDTLYGALALRSDDSELRALEQEMTGRPPIPTRLLSFEVCEKWISKVVSMNFEGAWLQLIGMQKPAEYGPENAALYYITKATVLWNHIREDSGDEGAWEELRIASEQTVEYFKHCMPYVSEDRLCIEIPLQKGLAARVLYSYVYLFTAYAHLYLTRYWDRKGVAKERSEAYTALQTEMGRGERMLSTIVRQPDEAKKVHEQHGRLYVRLKAEVAQYAIRDLDHEEAGAAEINNDMPYRVQKAREICMASEDAARRKDWKEVERNHKTVQLFLDPVITTKVSNSDVILYGEARYWRGVVAYGAFLGLFDMLVERRADPDSEKEMQTLFKTIQRDLLTALKYAPSTVASSEGYSKGNAQLYLALIHADMGGYCKDFSNGGTDAAKCHFEIAMSNLNAVIEMATSEYPYKAHLKRGAVCAKQAELVVPSTMRGMEPYFVYAVEDFSGVIVYLESKEAGRTVQEEEHLGYSYSGRAYVRCIRADLLKLSDKAAACTDFTDAVKDFSRAIVHNPDNIHLCPARAETRAALVDILLETGDYEAVIVHCTGEIEDRTWMIERGLEDSVCAGEKRGLAYYNRACARRQHTSDATEAIAQDESMACADGEQAIRDNVATPRTYRYVAEYYRVRRAYVAAIERCLQCIARLIVGSPTQQWYFEEIPAHDEGRLLYLCLADTYREYAQELEASGKFKDAAICYERAHDTLVRIRDVATEEDGEVSRRIAEVETDRLRIDQEQAEQSCRGEQGRGKKERRGMRWSEHFVQWMATRIGLALPVTLYMHVREGLERGEIDKKSEEAKRYCEFNYWMRRHNAIPNWIIINMMCTGAERNGGEFYVVDIDKDHREFQVWFEPDGTRFVATARSVEILAFIYEHDPEYAKQLLAIMYFHEKKEQEYAAQRMSEEEAHHKAMGDMPTDDRQRWELFERTLPSLNSLFDVRAIETRDDLVRVWEAADVVADMLATIRHEHVETSTVIAWFNKANKGVVRAWEKRCDEQREMGTWDCATKSASFSPDSDVLYEQYEQPIRKWLCKWQQDTQAASGLLLLSIDPYSNGMIMAHLYDGRSNELTHMVLAGAVTDDTIASPMQRDIRRAVTMVDKVTKQVFDRVAVQVMSAASRIVYCITKQHDKVGIPDDVVALSRNITLAA